MRACIAVLCLISVCLAQTTNHPHPTHEPNENESLTFAYNGFTHDLIVKQRVSMTYNCYIADLTDAEQKQIHTDSGLRTVELRVLQQLFTATMITDSSSIDAHNLKMCGHGTHNATMHYYSL